MLCLGISFCCNLLYVSYVAASGLSNEVADAGTTIARRAEIAQGLDNAAFAQIRLANTGLWLSLIAMVLIGVVAVWGFRRDAHQQ